MSLGQGINQTSSNIKYSTLIKGRRGTYKTRVPAIQERRKTKRRRQTYMDVLYGFFGPRETHPKENVIG